MLRFLLKIVLGLVLFTVAIAAVIFFVPWKSWVGERAIALLREKGFENASLTVTGLNLKGVTLSDVTFGQDSPLTLKNITIDYSLSGLRKRKLGGLTVSGLSLEMIKGNDNRWVMTGLENLSSREAASRRVLPVSAGQINNFPFQSLHVMKSTLKIRAQSWQAEFPVDLRLEKAPVPRILLKADSAAIKKGAMDIVTGPINVDVILSEAERQWEGAWTVKDVTVSGTPAPVPLLSGSGKITGHENHVLSEGLLQSSDKAYLMTFIHDQAINHSLTSSLLVKAAAMPWKEGQLLADNIKIPLSGRKAISVSLKVQNVSIDELIGTLTGKRVSATGTVSGEIPVTIGKEGELTFGRGTLKAAGPGTIMMPPEAIPGDSEQITMVRDILKDLRYTALSIAMNSDEKGELSILLALEGSNPAVYNGREVKLNVNLTGDLLDFIRQNIMFVYDPKSLLEAGSNAKN